MSQLYRKLLSITLVMVVGSPAYALFEVRGGLGVNIGDPEASTVTFGTEELPVVPAALALTADALFYLPMMPLGIGARYESFGVSNKGDVNIDLSIKRTSIVVNYRLLDTLIYVGPIATLGLSHSNSLEISGIANQPDRTYVGTMDAFSTYSIGVEAGVNLLGLMVGAELGQMGMNMKNPKTSSGQELGTDIDFTGLYAKILLGFGF